MFLPFVDSVTGVAVYINSDDVVTLRPDPANLDGVSIVKLRDGEIIRVNGDHREGADKLNGPL